MAMTETGTNYRGLRIAFWFVALVLGASNAWAARFTINPDGISYLDMGDAYWRGDWHMAVNAYWSPFYSWLLGLFLKELKPSAYWEYPLAHLVNFLIYVAALACFEFFLRAFIRYRRASGKEFDEAGEVTLPEWAWWALGYSLFIWTSLVLITVRLVTPDMCVAGFVYLATGLILQVRSGAASRRTFVLLGVTLGLAYLAKAVMFPIAFVFLAVALLSLGSIRKAAPQIVISALTFAVIACPFMCALSRAKGRITFGDSGRLMYAGCIDGVDFLFPGDTGKLQCVGEGLPEGVDETEFTDGRKLLHPVSRIFDTPPTYQFKGPVGGTYPFWYDPSYWQEGIKPRFDLGGQETAAMRGLQSFRLLYLGVFLQLNVTTGLCILYLWAPKASLCIERALANWPLMLVGFSALGLYTLVFVVYRYIAPFVLVLWVGAFSGVWMPESKGSRTLMAVVSFCIAATTIGSAGSYAVRNLLASRGAAPVYWQAATALKELGIRSGEKLAVVVEEPNGGGVTFVARLARTQIIAQVNRPDHFFSAPSTTQTQVLQAIANTGAQAILTVGEPPRSAPEIYWERLGTTEYYLHHLKEGHP